MPDARWATTPERGFHNVLAYYLTPDYQVRIVRFHSAGRGADIDSTPTHLRRGALQHDHPEKMR